MLFSIIIPYYFNYDSFFEECIFSVLHQSYCEDYEIIIVISSDDVPSISKHELNDKRISVQKCLNMDQSSKRNTGLDYAKGEYVIFLDCDDCLSLFFLDECKEIIEKYGYIDLIAFGFTREKIKLSEKGLGGYFCNDPSISKEYVFANFMTNGKKSDINFDSACMKAFRKSIIDRENVRFKDGLKCAEDAVFVRFFSIYLESIYMDNSFSSYFWRYNPISTMNSLFSGFLDLDSFCAEITNVLDNVEIYYKDIFDKYICNIFSEKIRFIVEKYLLNDISFNQFRKIIKTYFINAKKLNTILKWNLVKSFSSRIVLLSMRIKNTIPLLTIFFKKAIKKHRL